MGKQNTKNTPHKTISKSPAEAFIENILKPRLTLLASRMTHQNKKQKSKRDVSFDVEPTNKST